MRELARDYDVSHTTLSRYFRRPDVSKQLQQAEQLARAERRAAEARWRAEQKAAREARRSAKQRKVAEERSAAGRPPAAASALETVYVSESVRRGDGSVATGRSRHVPPLDLEPFSDDWLAWYAERRLRSEVDMLNCNDAFRGILPPLERRARERGPGPSVRKQPAGH